jgi:hypothetical protein
MKTKPKAPKKRSLLTKTSARTVGQRTATGGLTDKETDYLNQMLRKFNGDLDAALDALKKKYGHTGDY